MSQSRDTPTIEAGIIEVEYSSGRAPSGEWFAIGSVFSRPIPLLHPASIIVGTGMSATAAVDSLRKQVESEAVRQSVIAAVHVPDMSLPA